MVWYNPLSWFAKRPLITSGLTQEDDRAIGTLRSLLMGDRDMIDRLVDELDVIQQANDVTTAESLIPSFKKNLEAFERSAGVIVELQRSNVLKGTVLEALSGIKKKK